MNFGNLTAFLRVNSPLNMLLRMKHHKHNKKYLYRDGKVVNGTIHYYPRKPNEIEPPVEPAKLFRVHRVKPVRGNPYWERKILRDMGLLETPNVTVIKNIPENNARLWKIKHLVKIVPINFPHGEPTADDLNHTVLKENGDCIVVKNIEAFKQREVAAVEFDKLIGTKLLEGETLKKDTRQKWNNAWDTFSTN